MEHNFTQINSEEFKKEIELWESIVIDLRTSEELIKYWTITDNQIQIDVYQPMAWLKILKLDKDKKYLLYCWHWVRSDSIRDFMQQNKFTQVMDLAWWIDAWNKTK